VWAQERDIASAQTLAELLAECALPAQRLADATSAEVQSAYERSTQQAIAAGVFGSPSYVVQGEIFWGQDRLEFLERRLACA
jgi:carboxymethylenebutenolidase